MDLSLRAYVKGWKAIFLDDVTCLNELPASFFAYRKQQHRWTCGPIQLWSKASADIWAARIPLLRSALPQLRRGEGVSAASLPCSNPLKVKMMPAAGRCAALADGVLTMPPGPS